MSLRVHVAEGIATLTLDRPEQRSTLSADLTGALIKAIERLRDDAEVRVVVVAGDGPYGGHLARRRHLDLLEAIYDVGKPVVAAVNGAALGGGFGLVLACDLAVAADTATFGAPEVKVGLFPIMVAALLVRQLGPRHTMALAVRGEKIGAQRALELGLVNRVVPPGELEGAAREMARRLGREAVHTAADMEQRQARRYLHAMLSVDVASDDGVGGGLGLPGQGPSGVAGAVAGRLPETCRTVTGDLPDGYRIPPRQSPNTARTIAGHFPDDYQTVARGLPNGSRNTPDSSQTEVRKLVYRRPLRPRRAHSHGHHAAGQASPLGERLLGRRPAH